MSVLRMHGWRWIKWWRIEEGKRVEKRQERIVEGGKGFGERI